MRSILGLMAFAMVLGSSVTEIDAARRKMKRVVIDAGHGGHDSGAARGYVMEKHLAFDVCRRLERYLKRRNVKTVMTRRRDVFLPLSQRSRIANRNSDAVFVSVHFNWASNFRSSGTETFYYRDWAFGNSIQRAVARAAKTPDRGTKKRGLYVLRHTKTPAALVECAFISNWGDRRRALDPRFRQDVAEAIGEGIIRYLKNQRRF